MLIAPAFPFSPGPTPYLKRERKKKWWLPLGRMVAFPSKINELNSICCYYHQIALP